MNLYAKLMIAGFRLGCHQRPERSFFYKGYQFPICARCTGVLIGYVLSLPCFFLLGTNFKFCGIFAGIMLADWLVQYLKIAESTNIRRLITGILGGYGVSTAEILVVCYIMRWLFAWGNNFFSIE